jgi:adenylate cyclase
MVAFRKLFLAVQLPLIALWTVLFLIARCGDHGTLSNGFLHDRIYPKLRQLEGSYSDFKFRTRGARPVKQKIVIVGIDDRSVTELARWPWHRDAIALLLLQAFDAGAKVVGLDIAFPETDQRVPDGVVELLAQNNLADQVPQFETDLMLQRIIDLDADKLVLGWMSDAWCRPSIEPGCAGPDPGHNAKMIEGFEKFGFNTFTPGGYDGAHTSIATAPTIIGNLPGYEASAKHAGYLVAAAEEPDEIVRRAPSVMFAGGKPFPSLPLAMARVGLGDELAVTLDASGHVTRIALPRSKIEIPVDASGTMTINFRGGGYQFPFVSAVELFGEDEQIVVRRHDKTEKESRKELFENAYVLVGVTALGAHDLRNFPFGGNIPGTEGLATILDNVLTGDAIRPGAGPLDWHLVLVLMTLGAAAFGFLMMRLQALPAMLSALGIIGLLVVLDIFVVFGGQDIQLNTVFLFAELLTIFAATVIVKYVAEERGKKFIRSTFSKYLAPAVVDQLLADAAKLQLGGEERRLTIMMSDLRGFTAMAERMKPAEVLTVLNHYLGTMADIIMEFNGTIDEFIGDAILVIFGAPIPGKDDARRAVACAIAMQRAMKGINEHNAKLGLPKLEMGIALNTGEVIVGNIGSQKHIKYGVVGSHVNLTARIESNTVGGQVLISGTTLDLAGADIKVGEKQMIVAKGFPDPIPAFEIKGIGGEYNLEIEEVDLGLVDLATPADVKFRVMKSKNEEGDEQSGTLRQLSLLGATLELSGEAKVEAFQNLKMRVVGSDGALVDGDLYAKVMSGGSSCTLRFTAIPPAVEAAIKARIAS